MDYRASLDAMRARTIATAMVVCVASVLANGVCGAEYPRYEIEAVFDPERARLSGTATIHLQAGEERSIKLGTLRVVAVANGSLHAADSGEMKLRAAGTVVVRYEAFFRNPPPGDVIGRDHISLGGTWYPELQGTFRFRLKANVPRRFTAVSEADVFHRVEYGDRAEITFVFPHPQRDVDGITLVASTQWISRHARHNDVELAIHAFPRPAMRLDEILAEARDAVQRLESLLGRYPFKRLAIVENPVPLSYSLSRATYVLLARNSTAWVRASAPDENALNHEIAHQWFGNVVLVDDCRGNWCEGLATYVGEHLENERLGRTWQPRQRVMAAYQNNVAGKAESPLSRFTETCDRGTHLIGYAKSAHVFHMLRKRIGDQAFFAAIRRFVNEYWFREASWTDIQRLFERTSGLDLQSFFDQWLKTTCVPELGLQEVRTHRAGDGYELRFTVTQEPVFRLNLPVTVYFAQERPATLMLHLAAGREDFRRVFEAKPVRIVLDEDYDVFRRLTADEVPPNLDALLTRRRVTVVASAAERVKFEKLTQMLAKSGASIGWRDSTHQFSPNEEKAGALWAGDHALIFLGTENPAIADLVGKVEMPRTGCAFQVLRHPGGLEGLIGIFTAVSKVEVEAVFDEPNPRRRWSCASFQDGKLMMHRECEGQRGVWAQVHEDAAATERR